jgi:hypothetical protein
VGQPLKRSRTASVGCFNDLHVPCDLERDPYLESVASIVLERWSFGATRREMPRKMTVLVIFPTRQSDVRTYLGVLRL